MVREVGKPDQGAGAGAGADVEKENGSEGGEDGYLPLSPPYKLNGA
jgi:hypothetical protein